MPDQIEIGVSVKRLEQLFESFGKTLDSKEILASDQESWAFLSRQFLQWLRGV